MKATGGTRRPQRPAHQAGHRLRRHLPAAATPAQDHPDVCAVM